ncbi:hypothetical protein V499_00007 [Pseudogymnoascus sp. VKM F-103]|nr:hypothetical protein V499_00007 [Pseudogymnoascus sp. VKM F-103]
MAMLEKVEVMHLEENVSDEEKQVISTALVDPYNELANSGANKALLRKQDLRLIPLCALMYLVAYLDRTNIGNAKVMNSETKQDVLHSTKVSASQYSVALMVFLVAYTLFEVPANYFLKLMGPSRWFAFIMIVWGAISMCMGAVQNYAGLTVTRFLLGAFEAGLAPGLAYYVSFWYRADERSIRLAFIYSTATLSGAFGGIIAYGVSHLNNLGGLTGWRWLFLLEGVPSILAGFLVLWILPDYPETTKFLTPEESKLAVERMQFNGSHGKSASMTWKEAKETLLDARLYAHYIIYFTKSCPFSSLSLFTPSIVSGLGFNSYKAQLMTVPPYAAAFIVTVAMSYFCDKYNKRAVCTAGLMLVGAIGFIASATLPAHAYNARYGCLVIACCGTFATIPILLGWLSANLHSTSAQGLALALNISFGSPGQITGVWIYKDSEKGIGYPTGHWVNGGLLLLGAALTSLLMLLYTRRNRKIEKGLNSGPKWAL